MTENEPKEPLVIEEEAISQDDASDEQVTKNDDNIEIAPSPSAPRRSSGSFGFFLLLLGGIIAGAIGYAAATFDFLGEDPAASLTATLETRITELESQNATLAGSLADAQSSIQRLQDQAQEPNKPLADLGAQVHALSETVQGLSAIETRVRDLENRPIPDVGANQEAVATYERQLEGLREMFSAELQRIRQAQEDVNARQTTFEENESNSAARSAISRLSLAIETGAPFRSSLAELSELGITAPDTLAQHADGVQSIPALQQSFADAAREMIELDLKQRAADGEIGRLEAFMKSQLGVRSLAPRDGTDADAVLARAEAALAIGNLAAALTEVNTLDFTVSPLLSAWAEQAKASRDVRDAAEAFQEDMG